MNAKAVSHSGTEGGASRRRVAMARFSALGDVAMTIPAVYDACAANPDTDFVMLTRPAFTGLFINPPANLTVRGIDLKVAYNGIAGMIKLAGEISANVFVDLHDVLRTRVLRMALRLKGVRVTVFDKARSAKKKLVRDGCQKDDVAVTPTIDRYRLALQKAGLKMDRTFRGLFADRAASPTLYSAVTAPKQDHEKWVGVAPFAAHEAKLYPPERMRRVVELLAKQPNVTVFLFGGGGDEATRLGKWASVAPDRVKVVAGAGLGFGGELALMSSLDCMVSMDSGNMHMAAVTGTPTLSIWGGTHPMAGFTPWQATGAPGHVMMTASLSCSPCSVFGNKQCKMADKPMCMDPITVASVLDEIDRVIHGKQK